MSYQNFKDQVDLLLDIVEISLSDPRLALKGGTAINMFHDDMPRLSVDIDLCFLPHTDREGFIRQYVELCTDITNNLQTLPGTLVTIPKTREGFPKHIRVLRGQQIVKVEINWVNRGSVYEPSMRTLCSQAKKVFKKDAWVKVLSFEDVYAGKFCAALDRQHPRDLFDVMRFFNKHEITEKLKKAFIVYLISGNRPISEMIMPNELDQREMYEKEFLGMTEHDVSYAELEKARTELINQINIALNDDDKRFLISLKMGEPEWALLGVENIQNMPAVKWKLHNIRKMDAKRREKSLEHLRRKLGFTL